MNVLKRLFKHEPTTLEFSVFERELKEKNIPEELRKECIFYVNHLMLFHNEDDIGEKTFKSIKDWELINFYSEKKLISIYERCSFDIEEQLKKQFELHKVSLDELTQYIAHYDERARKTEAVLTHIIVDVIRSTKK